LMAISDFGPCPSVSPSRSNRDTATDVFFGVLTCQRFVVAVRAGPGDPNVRVGIETRRALGVRRLGLRWRGHDRRRASGAARQPRNE
jgi:hypothetical protein